MPSWRPRRKLMAQQRQQQPLVAAVQGRQSTQAQPPWLLQ